MSAVDPDDVDETDDPGDDVSDDISGDISDDIGDDIGDDVGDDIGDDVGDDVRDARDDDDFAAAALLPLAARLPLLPRAHARLAARTRGDARQRVLCLQVLAGAVGRAAVEVIVASLDDRSALVRHAAVAALATSAAHPHQGARMLHAAAHPRTDVRRAALAEPSLPPQLLTLLLADERLRQDALARLRERAASEPDIGAVVVRARRQGMIDDDDARAALRALPWRHPAAVLRALPVSSIPDAAVATSAEALLKHAVGGNFDDALVDVIAVVGADPAAARDIARALAAAAARRVLDEGDLRRLAVAIAIAALSQAAVPAELLAVAALGAPIVLALDGIDASLRRAAARALVDIGVARHENPLALLQDSDVLRAGEGYDVVAVVGVMRLCSERGYQRLEVLRLEQLAKSWALAPAPALLSMPPTSAADRLAYLGLLDRLAAALQETPPSPRTLAAVAVVLPFDGGRLLEGLEAIGRGTTLSVLTAIVDADADIDADASGFGAVEEKRLQRACEILCSHIDARASGALLRVVATSSLRRGARAVVRALSRVLDVFSLCDLVDGMTESHRLAILPLLLDEAPPVSSSQPTGLRALLPRSSSATLQALLGRREQTSTALSDDERTALIVIAAPHLPGALLAVASGRNVRGLAEVVIERAVVPRSVDVCAALLASHDSPAMTAKAVALALPTPTPLELEAVRWLLRDHFVVGALPFTARLFLIDDDDVALRFEREVRDAPGGLKAMIELALALPAPVDAILWHALATVVGRLAHVDRDAFARLVDARAVALLRDLARGEVQLLPIEPAARAAADELVRVACPGTAPAPPAVVAAPHPWWQALMAEGDEALKSLVDAAGPDDQKTIATAALLLGLVSGERIRLLLGRMWPRLRTPFVLEALRVVDGAAVLSPLVRMLPLRMSTLAAVDRLRDLFSWGSRQSIAIVGRSLGMTLIGDSLGYTRLKGSRVFVNPLPLLLGEEGGVDVVKGLIVHELGHHRYHTGDEGLAVWEAAAKERLHKLLNLVADEHLERNLRAIGPRFGHPLKTLAAHAFQHMQKEVNVDVVVQTMGRQAFAALSLKRLGVARRAGCVVVDVGAALFALEKNGSSFARFMRALRMGLGDRYDDARVREALALFDGRRFRGSDMPALMLITRRLREIFQDETRILDAFDLHELTDASPDDVVGDGAIDVDELGRAIAEPEARTRIKGKPARAGRPGRFSPGRVLNEDDDDHFDEITNIERVAYDATLHRSLADTVRRDSARLRQTLINLGRNLVVERRRLAGRRVDRGGLASAIIRGDPRLLVSRRILPAADLFLGVVIDCSGSMDGENLERARLFGAVIAEAARGLRGVDARFFGFTDEVIYDAGDARRCAVSSLVADGGNNDAAALLHVAHVARRSHRKTRLLVMVSDGSPTECSVSALGGLVARLSRQGFLCAQVAVEALDDICFPHYVLLDGDDIRGAVRGFASVVERLVLIGTGAKRGAT